jgi:MFS family permease
MSQSRIPPASERPTLWTAQFSALILAQVCSGYTFSSFFLLPTFLQQELAASASIVGWVMSVTPAAVVVLLPLAGHASDRLGRRPLFLAAGAFLMGLTSLGFALVDTVGPLLFALRVVQALAFAMTFAPGGALAVELAPPARVGQAVGLFGLTFLAMNGVASAVVERLAAFAGWPTAFATAGVTAFASALLSLRLREPRPATGPAEGRAVRGPGGSPVPARSLLIMAFAGLALGAMFSFAQLYATILGAGGVSHFFVAYASAGVLVRTAFGHLLDDWAPRRVAIGSLVAYALVVGATMKLEWFGLLAIGTLLGLAHGAFYPSFTTLTLKEAPASARGRVIAYVQAAFSVGGIATAALGMIADRFGYPVVFAVAAGGLVAALHLLASADRPRTDAAPADPAEAAETGA